MNVSNGRSVDLGTGVAAPAATKFPTMLKAAPMLAAAANMHHYRLCGLMSESNFPELLYGGQDSKSLAVMRPLRQTATSANHFIFPVPSTSEPAITARGLLAAEEPSCGSESLGATICATRKERGVGGPGKRNTQVTTEPPRSRCPPGMLPRRPTDCGPCWRSQLTGQGAS